MSGELLFKSAGICKNFGPTRALIDVGFELHRGDVCGLIGENGSGKSTLTSIIAGARKADQGEMYLKGNQYDPDSMLESEQKGVGMVVQEVGTLPGISVASNIFVGNFDHFKKHGLVDSRKMEEEAAIALTRIGVKDISPTMPVDYLNFEDRKIVEIARAMYFEPDILIIDEATTALAQKGREIVYNLIKEQQSKNKAVIFISHDLDEIMEICNTVTVLRDGVRIQTLGRDEMGIPAMRKLMVGRELTDHYFRADYDGSFGEKVVLKADRITSEDGMIVNLDLELHEGEILGIGGLANCGMHELGKMLYGINKPITGEVTHTESKTILKSPGVSSKKGVGYISKDRDIESMILNASIQDNIVLASLDKIKTLGLISRKKETDLVNEQMKALRIKCVSAKQFCTELSGGNKQKVALGKWLAKKCDILIMDCPTRGIDIGVKAAMYGIMYELKKQGKSIIMISEELLELIGMSDRMLIMKNGKIVIELQRDESITESLIIEHMI